MQRAPCHFYANLCSFMRSYKCVNILFNLQNCYGKEILHCLSLRQNTVIQFSYGASAVVDFSQLFG